MTTMMISEVDTRKLSAQQRAIFEGKKVLHGAASERVVRFFVAIRFHGPPRVALVRRLGLHVSGG